MSSFWGDDLLKTSQNYALEDGACALTVLSERSVSVEKAAQKQISRQREKIFTKWCPLIGRAVICVSKMHCIERESL